MVSINSYTQSCSSNIFGLMYLVMFCSTVRCHMLNVDVVTMFSPEMVDTLNNTVEQCEKCIKAMETLSSEDS